MNQQLTKETDLNGYFPFRIQTQLTPVHYIVIWHNADFSNTKYDFVQRIDANNFQVRASFRYIQEFIDYLSGLEKQGAFTQY